MEASLNTPATSKSSQAKSRRKKKNRSLYISDRIGLILISSLSLNLLLTFGLIWQIGNNATLALRKTTLVQLQDGDTLLARPHDAEHRESTVVLETAKTWFEMTYARTPTLPDGKRDPGIRFSTSNELKVPTPTYRASYLLPAVYRTAFLEEFAAKFTPAGYFKAENRTSIVRIWDAYILPDGNPEDGWTVEIISTVVDLNGRQEIRETPVNLSLKLHPVVPNVSPLGESDPSELRRAIADLRETGIAITSIEPLQI